MENTELIGALRIDSRKIRRRKFPLARTLSLASSVKTGIALLLLLGTVCMAGMVVMQQNVDGFADYYASLTPAQKYVYGALGLFNIYHTWFFNMLLSALALNLILATVERVPKKLHYFTKPAIVVPFRWLQEHGGPPAILFRGKLQDAIGAAEASMKLHGFSRATQAERNGRHYVFAQAGAWNRLAFCGVHASLLTIFLGGFITSQTGTSGKLTLAPGESSDLIVENAFSTDGITEIAKRLPFEVTFTDVRHELLNPAGQLTDQNTLDQQTSIVLRDETGSHEGTVALNRPFDHRGYRFFQSSATSVAHARNITLRIVGRPGKEPHTVTIARNGSAELDDGAKIRFASFLGDRFQQANAGAAGTAAYNAPAAILEISTPSGEMDRVTAVPEDVQQPWERTDATAGIKLGLLDFERAAERHTLMVQRDPGANVVYFGFATLAVALVSVFLFAHKRVWAVIEPQETGTFRVTIAGNTNRGRERFDAQIGILAETFFSKTQNNDR